MRIDGPMFDRPLFHEPKRTYLQTVVSLIGHLIGTAVIFITFLVVGWLISLAFHALNEIHRMPDRVNEVFTTLEVWWLYADAILCAFVLVAGMTRFAREVLGGRV